MEIAVIPAPVRAASPPGAPFVLNTGTRIVVGPDPATAAIATVVAESLTRLGGLAVPTVAKDSSEPGAVVLRLTDDRSVLGLSVDVDAARSMGAYRLEVSRDRVVVTALDLPGLLHGVATLEQTSDRTRGFVRFPPLVATDAPRFGWRGLSLDVARHFFDVAAVRKVIDVMAGLKLNVLHLHLTDDQGWRLDVPSRPELAARSGGTAVDGDPGGYYTVEDYQEIVAYAQSRCITVIPEIDVPGHVNAALHACGELTPSGEPAPAYTGIGVGHSRLHADLEATGDFLHDVFTDVAALTPGHYVHIGGDEVLTMRPAEYASLVQAAATHVRAAGKGVVGWQEIAKTPLGPDTVVQFWTGAQGAEPVIAAALAGAQVLLSPAHKVYLDMKYDDETPVGLVWAGHIEVRDAYDWEPLDVIPELPAECIVGVEAGIWSETIRSVDELFLLLLPRLAAVAEVAWSRPETRDWNDFAARLSVLAPRWTEAGLSWYRSPRVQW